MRAMPSIHSPSICGNNRVVFNVGGNKYRLVVEIQHQAGIRRPKQIRHCCETKSVTPPLMTTAGRQEPSNDAGFRGLRGKAVTSHLTFSQRSKFVTAFLKL